MIAVFNNLKSVMKGQSKSFQSCPRRLDKKKNGFKLQESRMVGYKNKKQKQKNLHPTTIPSIESDSTVEQIISENSTVTFI